MGRRVLPIGLGLSLILNGIFFAKPLNEMQLLTLPDLFARKFGPAIECLFSCLAIFSFLALLAGNLVGTGKILNFVFQIGDPMFGVWIATLCIWVYTVAGGLVSVAYTDCMQAALGWLGLVVGSAWVLNNMPRAADISPAYPCGDAPVVPEQMTNEDALAPIPNAIFFNWVTIFVLGFGNLAALDFQARVFGSKSPGSRRSAASSAVSSRSSSASPSRTRRAPRARSTARRRTPSSSRTRAQGHHHHRLLRRRRSACEATVLWRADVRRVEARPARPAAHVHVHQARLPLLLRF